MSHVSPASHFREEDYLVNPVSWQLAHHRGLCEAGLVS